MAKVRFLGGCCSLGRPAQTLQARYDDVLYICGSENVLDNSCCPWSQSSGTN